MVRFTRSSGTRRGHSFGLDNTLSSHNRDCGRARADKDEERAQRAHTTRDAQRTRLGKDALCPPPTTTSI